LARGLGWFSIALGAAEVISPDRISKLIGLKEDHRTLIRLFGLREITSGVGLLLQDDRAAWRWSRVVGDALDLGMLGTALFSRKSDKVRLAAAAAAVTGVTALDVISSRNASTNSESKTWTGEVHEIRTIAINKSPAEVYGFWRNLQNLPSFMEHLEAVTVTGEGRSHWVAKAPAGTTVEWDAVTTEDRPNQRISWRSIEGSDIDNSGTVEFQKAPGNHGTIVRVELRYTPPAGMVGSTIAKLFGEEPGQQISDDLRRLKQVLEVGEVVVSDGTYFSNGILTQRPAQPISGAEAAS